MAANIKIVFNAETSKAEAELARLEKKAEESKKKMARPAVSADAKRGGIGAEIETRKAEAEAARQEKAKTQAAIKAQAATVREAEAAVKAADAKRAASKKVTEELERQRQKLEELKKLGAIHGKSADVAGQNFHRANQARRHSGWGPEGLEAINSANKLQVARLRPQVQPPQPPVQSPGGDFSRIEKAAAKSAKVVESRFSKMKSRVGSIFSGISGVVTGALAAFGVGFGVATIKNTIDDLDNLGKAARNMGVSAEELQKFQHAAKSVNFPVGQIQPSFDKMRKIVGDAFNGVPDAQKKLASLGISMDELKGKTTSEQFGLFSDAITGIKDPTEQATVAMSIFGEQGATLLNFMREYKQSGADLAARGGVISDEEVAAAEAFNQACTNVAASLRGWAVNSGFIRQLLEIVEGLDAMATNVAKMKKTGAVETNKDPWMDYIGRGIVNGVGGLIGMGTVWNKRKGLGDWLEPERSGLYVAAPEKSAARKAHEAKKERQEKEAARAKIRAEEKTKAAREKAQKASGMIDSQVADLERKTSGRSDSEAERRREAIGQEVTKAERTAKAQGVELAPEKREKVEKAASALFDAEEAKKDAAGKQKIDDQISALEEKYKVQQMINAGKGREAAIQQEIERAEKSARDSGVEFTDEQRQRVTTAAGANYDQAESMRGGGTAKSSITGPVNNIYSDSLLRMGGVLGGIGSGQTDYTKKSSQTLDNLREKVNALYDKIPNRTETTGELEF